jgi:hypothetical protein
LPDLLGDLATVPGRDFAVVAQRHVPPTEAATYVDIAMPANSRVLRISAIFDGLLTITGERVAACRFKGARNRPRWACGRLERFLAVALEHQIGSAPDIDLGITRVNCEPAVEKRLTGQIAWQGSRS